MNPVRMFAFAQAAVNRLPEAAGRGLFNVIGTVVGLSNQGGVRQLRRNQARLQPGMNRWQARRLSARAMRSYMRYYYEVFRLGKLNEKQILARVRVSNDAALRAEFAAGRSVTAALTHAGNWDLAGAWSNMDLAEVHTIAEKLEPPELAEGFYEFRRSLGMTIYQLVKGGGALRSLARDMEETVCLTPILADRDLTASGIEVQLAGHAMLVAAGPALLAQRTGVPIYPIFTRYEKLRGQRRREAGTRWGLRIDVADAVYARTTVQSSPREREADLRRMSQEWVTELEPFLREYLVDWHMLQKVFVSDLDPERLARARARAQELGRAPTAETNAVPGTPINTEKESPEHIRTSGSETEESRSSSKEE
ncbi:MULTISPECIES: phosphatidylinositol mannoside acyltransferase [unclassified Actinobaculum]|uniref:phosphatidylinositol mannoside acyltransferase n=1 Tax=unclassified Actinobaculum TaxID=2609299 RepID=UPI000D526133|nr:MULTISPECIES: phosphatidylinositol mannoside acyltransferase [unclassified Actinobaculum]AWE42482.1 phosphatidylinositol mannoside acyltransferase [Actinobaculum sp. 313]RTE48707.1 phosphatidylinositol mannoside acyltransferase [Actinobaculum sp. 352]